MAKSRLLIVDDDREVAEFMGRVGAGAGFDDVAIVNSADAFKESLAEVDPAVIILDLTMPGTDGIELLHHLAQAGTRARILIVSGFDEGIRRMAYDIGAARGLAMAGVVAKPVRAADLRLMLARLRLEFRAPE
jgi:CheY-like chemotaxis protein